MFSVPKFRPCLRLSVLSCDLQSGDRDTDRPPVRALILQVMALSVRGIKVQVGTAYGHVHRMLTERARWHRPHPTHHSGCRWGLSSSHMGLPASNLSHFLFRRLILKAACTLL